MKINYITGNLFDSESKVLAHCISADFALGKGIATEFRDRYKMKKYLSQVSGEYGPGTVVLAKDKDVYVFNLVTKKKYWQKPTYKDFENSLISMRNIALENGFEEISMPRIGCGLDRLEWGKVEKILEDVFKDTNITLSVYSLLERSKK